MNNFLKRLLSFSIGEGKKTKRTLLICIVLASIIWTLNALNKDYTTQLKYPVEYKFNKKKYYPVDNLAGFVELEVHGFGWNLLYRSLWENANPVIIHIDKAGTKKIPASDLKKMISKKLNEIEIKKVLQDTLNARIDKKQKKTFTFYLKVKPRQLYKNYKIKKVNFTPAQVECVGPLSRLKNLSDSIPITLNNSKIKRNIRKKVNINFFDEHSYLSCNHKKTEIYVQLKKHDK